MNTLTVTRNTLLKSHPIDSSSPNLPPDFRSISLKAGEKLEFNWLRAKGNHWLGSLTVPRQGIHNWYIFRNHAARSEEIIDSPVVRKDQVEAIFGRLITGFQFQSLDKCLKQFDITTIPRVRHFLAQVAHESGGLKWMVELASGVAYEGRRDLGNTQPGDGPRFKGVDPLQMTGRDNYQEFANFVGDQRVMEGWHYVRDNYLFLPSGFWWDRNRMNALIDAGASVRQVTRRVNGGYNGLADREEYYAKAVKAI